MSIDDKTYKHSDLTKKIIGVFYDVYNELGHGFLEEVYERALALALNQSGVRAKQHVPVPVWFRETLVGDFHANVVVEDRVLISVKSSRNIEPMHEAQLLNFLRATDIEIGLLLNFGPSPQIKRMAFDNNRKGRRLTQKDADKNGHR